MSDNHKQSFRDAVLALAEIAGNGEAVSARTLRERCNLSTATLRRTIDILKGGGLIRQAPGAPAAYRPAAGVVNLSIAKVVDRLRAESPREQLPAACDLGLGNMADDITIGQLAGAMATVDNQLCPYNDLCNALRGLDEQCDPFNPNCPSALRGQDSKPARLG